MGQVSISRSGYETYIENPVSDKVTMGEKQSKRRIYGDKRHSVKREMLFLLWSTKVTL